MSQRNLSHPKSPLLNQWLGAAWRSLALFALLGCALSVAYAWTKSQSLLSAWRDHQIAIAESDLQAIKALSLMAGNGEFTDGMTDAQRNAMDKWKQNAIDALAKGGELIWLESASADEADGRNPDNLHWSWSVEPNGFARLKLSHALPQGSSLGSELTLARRFSVQEMPMLGGLDWLWAFLLFLFPLLGGIGLGNAKWARKRFLNSLAAWSKLISHPSSPMVAMDPAISMKEFDMGVASILQNASNGVHDRLETIQRSVEQSSRVMSAMPVGVLAFDQNQKLLFVNRAGSELLGLAASVQFGQSLIEVIRQPNVVNLIQQVAREPQVLEVELELPMSKATLRLRAHPLSDPGQSTGSVLSSGVLLTLTDETRLKQLENARRDFTANVSHELKTPLSAIKAYAETLLMGALEDEEASHRFVERIAEQATRLDSLIRDLLQLTRLQSQPDKPQLLDLLLDDVLKTCVEEHRTIGQAKKISIDTTGVQMDCRVQADLESLRTVIGNLLSNAVRYNRDQGWVRVSTRTEAEHIVLSIADSGIGIPPEDLHRIFERFYRVEKARSQDAGGTGLGLSIVKHLVQSMSAEIHVSSVLGKGSAFEVRLKRSPASDASPVPAE